MSEQAWYGVDLDGTLAEYDHWVSINHIGKPVPKMVDRVKKMLLEGKRVKIFTARVSGDIGEAELAKKYIKKWCREHIGQELEVTNIKDFGMVNLYDNRVTQVIINTGEIVVKEKTDEFRD